MGLTIFALRPIYNPTPAECATVHAEIEGITGNPDNFDIALHLKDDPNFYYINRGLETGLDIADLRNHTTQKSSVIHYVKGKSILNPFGSVRHVARLEVDGKILYNELESP